RSPKRTCPRKSKCTWPNTAGARRIRRSTTKGWRKRRGPVCLRCTERLWPESILGWFLRGIDRHELCGDLLRFKFEAELLLERIRKGLAGLQVEFEIKKAGKTGFVDDFALEGWGQNLGEFVHRCIGADDGFQVEISAVPRIGFFLFPAAH